MKKNKENNRIPIEELPEGAYGMPQFDKKSEKNKDKNKK